MQHPVKVIACSHRPPCAGCVRYGQHGVAPSAQAALAALGRRFHLAAVETHSGVMLGYRLRARLAIRGRLGSPKIGLYESGTHRVVHIPHCRVHHPLVNHVAACVRRALVDARVTCYSEAARQGVARYLQVVVERSSQSAQVVLVGNCATPEPLAECLELIRMRLGSRLHSLWFNSQMEASNVILGSRFYPVCGPPSIVETFGGCAVHYPPGAFGQSNLEIAQHIISHVRDAIPVGARVAEFYAGVGAIGLSVLEKVGAISMNEVSVQSLQGLAMGIAALDAGARSKVTIIPGMAGATAAAAQDAAVVVVDPPRKGLDGELCDHLSMRPPELLLYVSCAIESLQHDVDRLTARGGLRLTALQAFDMMPFTEHVETVARLERATSA